jgi:uncharacterized protein YdhG (YjbR/CyaY superfamily)
MNWVGASVSMPPVRDVDEYVRTAPVGSRTVLGNVRAAILEAAPGAVESISYGIPFYSYPGETGVGARLCYFRVQRAALALYLRPKDLEPHAAEIDEYRSSKSGLRFRLDEPVPLPLIRKLVRDARRRHIAERAK